MNAAEALRRIPLFGELTSEELAEVARIAKPVSFAAGDTLCAQGSAADCAFVVVMGEAIVSVRDARGKAREISRIGSGEVIGELGLVDGQPRSADVVASEPIRGFRVERAQLDAMRAALRPAAFKILRRIAVTVSERLREINTEISEQLAQGAVSQSAPQSAPQPGKPSMRPPSSSHANASASAGRMSVPQPAPRMSAPQPAPRASTPRQPAAAVPAGPAKPQAGPRVQALQQMLSRLSNAGHK